jgi:hypothetical protein
MVDFDAMGAKGAAEHWDEQEENFMEKIVEHVKKVGPKGFVPIDLRGFGADEIEAVRTFVMDTEDLSPAERQQIIPVGWRLP